jgi:hypothetical protein
LPPYDPLAGDSLWWLGDGMRCARLGADIVAMSARAMSIVFMSYSIVVERARVVHALAPATRGERRAVATVAGISNGSFARVPGTLAAPPSGNAVIHVDAEFTRRREADRVAR